MKREDYISWDEYFMGIAKLSGMRSKDPNTQVGACIVSEDNKILSVGYNGFPIGCSDEEFPWDRTGDMIHSKSNQRNYLQSGSYVRTGWGGVLVDACWRGEHIWPFVGGSVGGGAMRTLAVSQGSEEDWLPEESAVLHKQGFMYINPYIGIDWCMTKRVHVCLRMDWMLAFAERSVLFPTGPRLYVGFMFCH